MTQALAPELTHIRYTTAPEAYDGFGTVTLELLPTLHNRGSDKPFRKVEIQDEALGWQIARYESGMYPRLDEATFQDWLAHHLIVSDAPVAPVVAEPVIAAPGQSPELAAAFDLAWKSSTLRRPKCSKSDFYAGWLAGYQAMPAAAPVIVARPKLTLVKGSKPVAKSAPAAPEDRSSVICDGDWRPVCTNSESHAKECSSFRYEMNERLGHREMITSRAVSGPERDSEVLHVYKSRCECQEPHTKLVTHYAGALPLAHHAPKGPKPSAGCYGVMSGQAIPDSLLSKLAKMAGKPWLAP